MRIIFYLFVALVVGLSGCKQHTEKHTEKEKHHHLAEKHDHEKEKHEGHHHDEHKKEKEVHHGHDHGHDHGHAHGHDGHEHAGDVIRFTPNQAAQTAFVVERVHPKMFHQVIKVSGQILPAPGDETLVVAGSNGVVSFHSSTLVEGFEVKKGENMFYISSRNMAEGDFYHKTKVAYETAKANFERAELLVKEQIISRKVFEEAQLAYTNARLAFEAVAKKQTNKGLGVASPMNGFVKNLLVKEGEYVTVGQPLATVTQNRRLVLRAEVPERHYAALASIRDANFKTPYRDTLYELSALNGRLLSKGRMAGDNSFYLPISFDFDNRGEVIPGSFVEVFLLASPIENALTIPVSALTNELGHFYVYVQLHENEYCKQEVVLGAHNGKEVQVLKGLHAGDKVVTKGAYQVKMAAFSGAIPHGHEH